ncbi:hypothetical protein [Nonomuraea jabiensis]|uniref:Uncharacterized protein n=1 Tax=Nonomuraea jabiensis TaxID=882448 RepID=A0A7W9FYV9_9ACTN|nr:hypothetical protein [Nonomuraea jabiensis]MBB5774036.1 hypothetical protein [Nonomuraea jabiensis]
MSYEAVQGIDPVKPQVRAVVVAFLTRYKVLEKVGALARLWQPLLLEADTTFAPVLADRQSHRVAFKVPAASRLSTRAAGE